MLATDVIYSKEEFLKMIGFILNPPVKIEDTIDWFRRVMLVATEKSLLNSEL